MLKDRKNTKSYLFDICYNGSMNNFYEFYGDNVPYSIIEQDSYIDLKQMVHSMINSRVKFRKFERNGMVLTLKVDMLDKEKEKLDYLLNENEIKFFHKYKIKNIKLLKQGENKDEQ